MEVVFSCYFDSWWKKVSKVDFELFNFEKLFLMNEGVNKVFELDFLNFWY